MHVKLLDRIDRPGMRLGRHEEHDPASLAFAHPVLPASAIHTVIWTRRTTILNQGQIGSCTGNALTGALGTDSVGRVATTTVTVKADRKHVFEAGTYELDEKFAALAYALNTHLDRIPGYWPRQDTGSSSLACGKTGKELGLFAGYQHAFSYEAMLSALQNGPVLIGIPWYQSMFKPDTDGMIQVRESSGLAGGHELMSREYDAVHDRVWIDNSWDLTWGVRGRGYIRGRDLRMLLADGGDVLVPKWATA